MVGKPAKRRRIALDGDSNMNICDSVNKDVVWNLKPQKTLISWTNPPKCIERRRVTAKFMASTPIRDRSPIRFEMNWLSPVGTVLPELRNIEGNNVKNKSPVVSQRVPEYLPLIGEKKKKVDCREKIIETMSQEIQPIEGCSSTREPLQAVSKNAVAQKFDSTNSKKMQGEMVQMNGPKKAMNNDKLLPKESQIIHMVSVPVSSFRECEKNISAQKLGSYTDNENDVQKVAKDITNHASNNKKLAIKPSVKLIEHSDSKDQTTVRQEVVISKQPRSSNVDEGCVKKLQTGLKSMKESNKISPDEIKMVTPRKNLQQTTAIKLSQNDSKSNSKTVSSSVGLNKLILMDSDEEETYLDNIKCVEESTKNGGKKKAKVLRDIQNVPAGGKTGQTEFRSTLNVNKFIHRTETVDLKPINKSPFKNEKSKIKILENTISKKLRSSKGIDCMSFSRIPKLIPEILKQQKTKEALSSITPKKNNKRSIVKNNRSSKTAKVVHSPKRPIVSIRSTQSLANLVKSPKKKIALMYKNITNPNERAISRIPTIQKSSVLKSSRRSRVSFSNPLVKMADIRKSDDGKITANKELQHLLVQNRTFCISDDEDGDTELKNSSENPIRSVLKYGSSKAAPETSNVLGSSNGKLTNGKSQVDRVMVKSKVDKILMERENSGENGHLIGLSNPSEPANHAATERLEAAPANSDINTHKPRKKTKKPDRTTIKDSAPHEDENNLAARNHRGEIVTIGSHLRPSENISSQTPKKDNDHSNKISENNTNVYVNKLHLQSEDDVSLMNVVPAGLVEQGLKQKKRAKPSKRIALGVPANAISEEPLDDGEIPAKLKKTHQELSNDTLGLRRSSRCRSKPLDYWNGERLGTCDSTVLHALPPDIIRHKKREQGISRQKYDKGRVSTTTALKDDNSETSQREGVNVSENAMKKHIKNIEEVEETEHRVDIRNTEDVVTKLPIVENENDIVFEPDINTSTIGIKKMIRIPVNGKNVQMECITDYAAMRLSSKQLYGARGDVIIGKGLNTAMGAISSGSIEMRPHSAKGSQIPKLHHLIFCVMTGSIIVTIHHARKRISTGGHFFIPCGISYNLENDGNMQAILSFFKITKGCINLDGFN